MAKLLKKTFGLGNKKAPPAPPKPDYRGGLVGALIDNENQTLEPSSLPAPIQGTSRQSRENSPKSTGGAAAGAGRGGSRQHKSKSRSRGASRAGPSVGPRSSSIPNTSSSGVPRRDGPILLQDYSEPFDANRSNLPASPRTTTDDYTEPYDATNKLSKRMAARKKERSASTEEAMQVGDDGDVQLYDDPLGCDLDDVNDFGEDDLADEPSREEYEEPWEISFKNSLAHWQSVADGSQDNQGDDESPLEGTTGGFSPMAASEGHTPEGAVGGITPDEPTDASSIQANSRPSLPRSASAGHTAKTHVEIEIGKFVNHKNSDGQVTDEVSDPEANGDENMGNYEEPWDLQAKTLEIENKLRAAKKRLSKPELRDGEDAVPENNLSKNAVDKSKRGELRHQMSLDGQMNPLNDNSDQPLDYDEPWDLKKKNVISQLTAAVTTYRAQEGLGSSSHAASTGSLPSAKHSRTVANNSPPTSGTNARSRRKQLNLELGGKERKTGEKIDPVLNMDKQGWFHGSIGRVEAENMLRPHKEGSFLVRNSESSRQDFSLSLKSSRGFMHMKIVYKDNSYILGQFSQPYKSIPEMIHHYSIHKLPIKGAEHMSLLHPVTNELL